MSTMIHLARQEQDGLPQEWEKYECNKNDVDSSNDYKQYERHYYDNGELERL